MPPGRRDVNARFCADAALARAAPEGANGGKEFPPPAAEAALKIAAVSAAFDIDRDLHQRLPPSSPDVHSAPSL